MNGRDRQLLIRADASREIGFGHVMRCIALGQAWRDEYGPVAFVSRPLPAPLEQRLREEQFGWFALDGPAGSVGDAGEMLELIQTINPAAIVADGYRLGPHWQKIIRRGDTPCLVIDDYVHLDQYPVDLILNQNPGADLHRYRARDFRGRLLSGCRFALLRQEFVRQAHDVDPAAGDPIPHLVVTLGGFDPGGVTEKVIASLNMLPASDFRATVVVPGREPLPQVTDSQITIVPFVDDMAKLLAECDLAICGGGSTNWEMCLLGIPRVVLVLAGNQQAIARHLQQDGCCLNLGWHATVTPRQIADSIAQLLDDAGLRRSMADANRNLVDGQGARRVCEVLAAA